MWARIDRKYIRTEAIRIDSVGDHMDFAALINGQTIANVFGHHVRDSDNRRGCFEHLATNSDGSLAIDQLPMLRLFFDQRRIDFQYCRYAELCGPFQRRGTPQRVSFVDQVIFGCIQLSSYLFGCQRLQQLARTDIGMTGK